MDSIEQKLPTKYVDRNVLKGFLQKQTMYPSTKKISALVDKIEWKVYPWTDCNGVEENKRGKVCRLSFNLMTFLLPPICCPAQFHAAGVAEKSESIFFSWKFKSTFSLTFFTSMGILTGVTDMQLIYFHKRHTWGIDQTEGDVWEMFDD